MMKKVITTIPFILAVFVADASVSNSISDIELSTLKLATSNTKNAIIDNALLEQTNYALEKSKETIEYLKLNKGNFTLHEFTSIYNNILNMKKIRLFGDAILQHGGSTVISNAIESYSYERNNCTVNKLVENDALNQIISVKCFASVYGENTWIDPNNIIEDKYTITLRDGNVSLESISFGLLSLYVKNINTEINNKSKNDNVI